MKTAYGRLLQGAAACLLAAFAATAVAADSSQTGNAGKNGTTLAVTSSAFGNNQTMPSRFTCDGQDTSPPISWTGMPTNAKSLALIVEDPDVPDHAAPKRTATHWLLYNMPPSVSGLPECVSDKDLPRGTLQGRNEWRRTGYGGPCPPIGQHRYFFRLYVLDTMLPDLKRPGKAKLENAIKGHIIARGELIGLYQKQK